MSAVPRVLLVADPRALGAFDYLARGEAGAPPGLRFELLWWERRPDQESPAPAWIEAQHYWSDHATPGRLLDRLQPDRVVLSEIIDLRQIALIIAARGRGLPSYYLEHGAAGDAATARRRMSETSIADKLAGSLRSLRRLPQLLAVRRFYLSVLPLLNSARSRAAFLAFPQALAVLPAMRALRLLRFPERVPATAILFSRANLEEFALFHGPESAYRALLPGVPFFDGYYRARPEVDPDTVVYIEHPYLEEGLNGWTPAHHERIARTLDRFARERGKRVLVKLHPRSNLALWQKYQLDPAVEVAQVGDYSERFLRAEMILSYASSLLTGMLCARKNVTYLRWHPGDAEFGAPFHQSGLCHTSGDPDDLFEHYDEWLAGNLCVVNEAAYQAFLDRFNWPFDGQAARRVRQAILEPAGSQGP